MQIEPIVFCENRWVEFEVGNKIALYNKKFDEQKIKDNSNIQENYNKAYIDDFNSKNQIKIVLNSSIKNVLLPRKGTL